MSHVDDIIVDPRTDQRRYWQVPENPCGRRARSRAAPCTPENDEIERQIQCQIIPLLLPYRDWICVLMAEEDAFRKNIKTIVLILARAEDVDDLTAKMPLDIKHAGVIIEAMRQGPGHDCGFSGVTHPGYGQYVQAGHSLGARGSAQTHSLGIFVHDASGQLYAITSAGDLSQSDVIVTPSEAVHRRLLSEPAETTIETEPPQEPCKVRTLGQCVSVVRRLKSETPTSGPQLLDLALIRVAEDRVPPLWANLLNYNRWIIYGSDNPSAGVPVLKVGHVTGMSERFISNYRAKRCVTTEKGPVVLEEWCVLGWDRGGPFCNSSETGAAILDPGTGDDFRGPKLVGIVSKVINQSFLGQITLFTPWQDVLTAFKEDGYDLHIQSFEDEMNYLEDLDRQRDLLRASDPIDSTRDFAGSKFCLFSAS